jgi:hypothetical protein
MNAEDRNIGLLAQKHQDSIRFYFAKQLSYSTRLNIILGCFCAGFLFQIYFLNFISGAPLLIAGIAMSLAKGYDSRVRYKFFKNDANWTETTIEKTQELDNLRKKNKKWDRDALDISNWLGCLTLIALLISGFFFSAIIGALAEEMTLSLIILGDILLIIIPFYFTGLRFILKQNKLVIKTHIILMLNNIFQNIKNPDEQFIPSMMLGRDRNNQTIPIDLRFAIKFPGMPAAFYGLMAQININLVQGNSYPYFYCVLVSKPGFGLSKFQSQIKTTAKIICEYQSAADAEVLVIRQQTTKKSGYETPDKICVEILTTALDGARKIMKASV